MSADKATEPHIVVDDLGICFGKGTKAVQVLEGVELNVQPGEFVSLIGHSGCGKSTLLKLIAGFYPATGGSIAVAGKTVAGPGPDRMMVFQNHSLLPWMTVRQNIMLAAKAVFKDTPKSELQAKVTDMLDLVGLSHAADKRPGEISGGMKQRAGIGRALITEPEVLLLDEPFGALDALTRGKLQESLLEIWDRHRITVVMVTHDVDEAVFLSDRVIMMSNGPHAKVAEELEVELPRPRLRMEVVNHPLYYPTRNRLTHFLSHNKHTPSKPEKEESNVLKLGFIPLSDCAPLVYAKEKGLFAKHGLDVELSREASWRTVSKGVMSGRLDGSMLLAPTAVYHNVRHADAPEEHFQVGLVLSRNGNGITLRHRHVTEGRTDRDSFCKWIKEQGPDHKPRLGVVFRSSMHNLLLRKWLKEGGVDPDTDCEIMVVPPAQMVANLDLGNLEAVCVGEPWNTFAVEQGLGRIADTSLDLLPDHPEKVFAGRKEWVKEHPEQWEALVKALDESCKMLADETARAELPALLSRKEYVGLSEDYLTSLTNQIPEFAGSLLERPGFHKFSMEGSTELTTEDEEFLLNLLQENNLVPKEANPERVFSPTAPATPSADPEPMAAS